VFKIVKRYAFQAVAACCKNTGITICIYFFCAITVGAQTIPQQKISIDLKDVPLAEVLSEISIKSNLRFSYNPKRMEAERQVSYRAVNKSVSEILTELAEQFEFQYSIVEDQVVLKPKGKAEKTQAQFATLSGYIKDASQW
jgi:type II secretory pathway component GspD/PulD (secretin)